MYSLIISPKAARELKELKKRYRGEVKAAIEELQEDPFIGKPLIQEFTGKYSYRIDVYRIIYTVNTKDRVVYIISAGHRSVAYRS